MPINIAQLEQQFLAQSAEQAPGSDFCNAIAELARTRRFSRLRGILPPVVYEEFRAHYKHDPDAFIAAWTALAQDMRRGFMQHARQRLMSLTRTQLAHSASSTPSWQAIQRALDTQQNHLLRTALLFELLNLVEPAVQRADALRECIVAAPSSDETDRYLDEATRCFLYGLFTASAVMCRSVLEEAIKQKLPHQLVRLISKRYRDAPTLGNLLHEVNNNLNLTAIDPAFLPIANRVNDTGKRAVHCGLMSEEEARHCLESARHALQLLLQP